MRKRRAGARRRAELFLLRRENFRVYECVQPNNASNLTQSTHPRPAGLVPSPLGRQASLLLPPPSSTRNTFQQKRSLLRRVNYHVQTRGATVAIRFFGCREATPLPLTQDCPPGLSSVHFTHVSCLKFLLLPYLLTKAAARPSLPPAPLPPLTPRPARTPGSPRRSRSRAAGPPSPPSRARGPPPFPTPPPCRRR